MAMTKLKKGRRIFAAHISFSVFPADDLADEQLGIQEVVDPETGRLVYINLRPEGTVDELLIHFGFGRKPGEPRETAMKMATLLAGALAHLAQHASEATASPSAWPTGPAHIGCYVYKLPVVERNKPTELFVTRGQTGTGSVIEWRFRPFGGDLDLMVQGDMPTDPGKADCCFARLMGLLSRWLNHWVGISRGPESGPLHGRLAL